MICRHCKKDNRLTEVEKNAIIHCFGLGKSVVWIANIIGVSRATVRRVGREFKKDKDQMELFEEKNVNV